jgi:uncharacterized membrane protein YczE
VPWSEALGRPPRPRPAAASSASRHPSDRLAARTGRPAYDPPVRQRFIGRAILGRLPGLLLGLVVFGLGIALMARAGMGLGPWEAFHQGIQVRTGIPMGTVSIILGIPILALWWPLGQRPGIGTLLNVLLIGTATNAGNVLFPTPGAVPAQLAMMLGGVVVIGLGSGLYLAADLGPGPRDGLMTGIHRRFGWSIRRARTAIELTVLGVAWLLGGTIGIGTIVFAFGIGPVVQVMLGRFDRGGRVARRDDVRVLEEGPGSVGE